MREIYTSRGRIDRQKKDFRTFQEGSEDWLPGYALFRALHDTFNTTPWFRWPEALRTREPNAIRLAQTQLAEQIQFEVWLQYQFFQQWADLRRLCDDAGILIFGDMPLYVSHNSADVWLYPELFKLESDGTASSVAGVPPDYFSPSGQRWGNPIYDWDVHCETGFDWWIRRMQGQTKLYDIVRIDHFRGLESYWEVPGSAITAETGEWQTGPGNKLLNALTDSLPDLTIVAEDLGTITSAVDELRNQFALPGIRVLQFGFDGKPENPHAPENVAQNMVLYTGTHDNDTSIGWYHTLPDEQQTLVSEHLMAYEYDFPTSLIACAFANQADTVIVPMQDLLKLDTGARTNTPGTTTGNWRWRLPNEWPREDIVRTLRQLCDRYDRR